MPTLKATPRPETMPAGRYKATFVMLEDYASQSGDALYRWAFDIKTRNGGHVSLTGLSSQSFGPKSKARRWAGCITGAPLADGEMFDSDAHAGQPVELVVSIVDRDGVNYNRLDDVLPVAVAEEALPF